jgi:hypothetical protein
MNEVPDTEWFSAYLDGELTADEQRRVEMMLAASPEARQLLEDFRALGATLQSLPQQTLDEDLSLCVLEAAEQRMLNASESDDETREQDRVKPVTGRAAETVKPRWREISWQGMLSRRALVWSGIAVAVALMLVFISPPEHKVSRIAMTDKDKVESRKKVAEASGEHAAAARGDASGDWRMLRSSHRPEEEQATALGLPKDGSAKEKEIPALRDDAKRAGKSGQDGPGASSVVGRPTMHRMPVGGKPEAAAVPARTTTTPHPENEPIPGSAPVAGIPPAGIATKSDSAPRDETILQKAKTEATKDCDTRKRFVGTEASDKNTIPQLESVVVDQPAAPASPSFVSPAAGGRGGALGGSGGHVGNVAKAAKMPTEPMQPWALKPVATVPAESGERAMSARKAGVAGRYDELGQGRDTSQVATEPSPRADFLKNGANFYRYEFGNVVSGGSGRQNGQVGGNSTPALVVSLDISPAAARQKAFESLLQGLGMVDMHDPVAVRHAYSGGYKQQDRLGEERMLGAANGQTISPNVAQAQVNLKTQPVTGNAINSKPAPSAPQAPTAKKGAEYDRPGSTAQPPHGGQISGNVPPLGSPRQIVYDIDATSAQVFDVLQQIAQKTDTFSSPVIQSATRANDNEATASRPADSAPRKIDEATQAAADASQVQGTKEELLRAAKSRPAGSGTGTFAMQRKPAEWQEANQVAAVPTRHVRFVLQVVDRRPTTQSSVLELAPTTAAPAPAALPPAPVKQ